MSLAKAFVTSGQWDNISSEYKAGVADKANSLLSAVYKSFIHLYPYMESTTVHLHYIPCKVCIYSG